MRNQQLEHVPVLLKEAIDFLDPKAGGVYVDGTLGAGGHASEILRRSAPDGMVIGIDQDAEAVQRCTAALAGYGNRVVIRRENFRNIDSVLRETGHPAVDGVLLDLGVSLFHLKTPERGFSFMLDGPLDMRMDKDSRGPTAADIISKLSPQELAKIFYEYGEERRAGAIARAIEKARTRGTIASTAQLAGIVASVFPSYPPRRTHPATQTFQALRIAVNDEIEALRDGLREILVHVKPQGRIVVITFHSLEDRIVKQAFAAAAQACVCPPKMPACSCGKKSEIAVLTRRPVKAGPDEVERNPAARSAKLRAAVKL